jgi:mono/diheme cytochrome c family protein
MVSGVIRPALVLVVLAIAGLSVGCGGTGVAPPGSADLANGKTLFMAKCGACHTLADAGTQGTVGPNLDEAYVADRISGTRQSSFEALVRGQIEEPNLPMPTNLVTGTDARDVAAYVASVAAVKLAQQLQQQDGITTTPP